MEKLRKDAARCIPILASLDIAESYDFYVSWLGFRGKRFDDHGYLIVERDEMELHFWLTADRIHSDHTSCYIRGGQVASLYDEFRKRGVPELSEFAVRPWDMKEFYIRDPHGNLLKFGCEIERRT